MDNRDASLPSMVSRRVAVLLVLLWDFLRLRRIHRALRSSLQGKEGSWVDGAVPRHSIELALDIIAWPPARLQGPLSLQSSSQKIFSYARAINGGC